MLRPQEGQRGRRPQELTTAYVLLPDGRSYRDAGAGYYDAQRKT